jgi:predicted AAA+ superfamily ATPase
LKEEIQAEAATRNLPGFARFLPIAGLFHGQTLNVSALARDAGLARTTVQGYLGILEDTLFTFRLPAFEARLRVRERRHPKLYRVDPGLVRTVISDRGAPDADSVGRLFEGWVVQLLRAYRAYRKIFDDLVYWAPTESGEAEVDFLLHRGRERLAIEVKASRCRKPEHASGLRGIAGLPGRRRRILIYLGAERLRPERGIEVLPLAAFLSKLDRGLG